MKNVVLNVEINKHMYVVINVKISHNTVALHNKWPCKMAAGWLYFHWLRQ